MLIPLKISAAFLIKYDNFDAKGKGDFLNTSKVKESDVSFMISVKVVNQVIQDHSLTKFNPISGLKGQNFAEVYGDSFISGSISHSCLTCFHFIPTSSGS